jgi:hypothetical protein
MKLKIWFKMCRDWKAVVAIPHSKEINYKQRNPNPNEAQQMKVASESSQEGKFSPV